jgi:hypothetical protein
MVFDASEHKLCSPPKFKPKKKEKKRRKAEKRKSIHQYLNRAFPKGITKVRVQ